MIQNRKATYDYFILDKFTAGIILTGPEVKSIRNGDANIGDAFCYIKDGELWLKGMYVKPYKYSRIEFDPSQDRKLLLKKKELRKISDELADKGKTLIPLSVNNDSRLIKVNIGIGKGKKNYDKRETIKKRDSDRELQRYRS